MMINWHERFGNQLQWTKDLRNYLYNKIVFSGKDILEVGCGTGQLLAEIGENFQNSSINLFGIDIDEDRLNIAKKHLKNAKIKVDLINMDATMMDFEDNSFDIVVSHYFFLWIDQDKLEECFREISRVLKPDGILLILAEPDYGGMTEYPRTGLKTALKNELCEKGANPEVGRILQVEFNKYFNVKENFCISIPWLASDKRDLLKAEAKFFLEILGEKEFNYHLMNKHITLGDYYLFMPVFAYYLENK